MLSVSSCSDIAVSFSFFRPRAECTVHQKIEFILKLLNLIMSEGTTPRRNTVSGQVIGTSKKSAMNVVRGKVQARQNLVETFGNWWEVNLTPFDSELYFCLY